MKFKKLIATLAASVMLFSTVTFVSADSITPAPADTEGGYAVESFSIGGTSMCHEETVWYVRKHNGVWQKRLWSITYGVWLTDWEPL